MLDSFVSDRRRLRSDGVHRAGNSDGSGRPRPRTRRASRRLLQSESECQIFNTPVDSHRGNFPLLRTQNSVQFF